MGLGDLAGDGEAKACSLLGPRGVRPVEALEDEGQLALGDTNSRIKDSQHHAVVFILHPDRDVPAVRGVLHRIVQQNVSYLQYALPIEVSHDLVLAGNELDGHLAVSGRPRSLGRLLRNRAEVVTP